MDWIPIIYQIPRELHEYRIAGCLYSYAEVAHYRQALRLYCDLITEKRFSLRYNQSILKRYLYGG